ncbi:MAG: hypothetical protein QNL04_15645 [SAR324 cluster bacterium]|nr:hypothetical protein [SAR324 cluster bacterium]
MSLLLVSNPLIAAECSGVDCLPKKVKKSCTEQQANGCIDWEKGVIYATGMGVANPKFKSAAQRKYSSHQAALVVAKRNLLEMVEDVQISSSQTVKEGMLESDVIKTEIHGTLRHVAEVGRPKSSSDGSTWVTVKMYMRDILGALSKNEGFAPMGGEVANSTVSQAENKPMSQQAKSYGGNKSTIYTGVIIDASGTGVKPAMSPKILSASGEEVYGSFVISRKYALEFGVAAYVKEMNKAKANERVKGNPLLLKATLHSSAKKSDLKLSDADADLLKELNKTQTFLKEARVIILL